MKKSLACLFMLGAMPLFAQINDTLQLNEVSVTANIIQTELKNTARSVSIIDRKTIEASPVKTIDGILQYALNIDVRSRSTFGVQADISIRGGHYDQTLLLVDGVKVNDPQTGHHALNIPIPFSSIEKIEVLQGGASRVFGPSAFSGVINIITRNAHQNAVEIHASLGEYGTWEAGFNTQWVHHNTSIQLAYDQSQSDGYIRSTDFQKKVGRVSLTQLLPNGSLQFSYGLLDNQFGESNAYHPKYFDQYEEINAQLFNTTWKHQLGKNLSSTLMANFRKHNDMYDFDNYRLQDQWNSLNFHETQVWDADWKMKYQHAKATTAWGLEYRNEQVFSNRLGLPLQHQREVKGWRNQWYTLGKHRENVSLFLEHARSFHGWDLKLGSLINFNSQYGTDLYPGIDLAYRINTHQNVYYSINRSLRYPTFTELFLNNATVKADENLLPEKALTHEIGYKLQYKNWNSTYAVFYTQSQQAIDKVKRPELEVPTMENISDLNRGGIETQQILSFKHKYFEKVMANYAWIHSNHLGGVNQSFYTLNYLKHKASIGVFITPFKNASLSLWYTYKNRAGQYAWDANSAPIPYGDFSLFDLKLSYQVQKIKFSADANNVLNKTYFEHGFVQQPPRWLKFGIQYFIL